MTALLNLALRSVTGRWILGGLVALSLGSAAIMWHNHKGGLREEGRQECIQRVNEETHKQLIEALEREKVVSAALRAEVAAAAEANADAVERLAKSQSSLNSLLKEMEEQKKNDEEYAEWSGTSIPAGVADRLRSIQSGSN